MSSFFALLFAGHLFITNAPVEIQPIVIQISPPAKEIHESIQITAESALVMDVSSGMIMYKKNMHTKRSIASITKLMTAIITLDKNKISDIVLVSKNANNAEGSKMFLFFGERLTLANLMTGLLVGSANDSAIALAEHTAGSVEEFVSLMNQKAHYYGLKNTSFANPHGLDSPLNYSTAFDVAHLAKKALENDFIRKIVQLKKASAQDVSGKFRHELITTNELLNSPFPVYGLKTGTTDEAGQCFVGLIRIQNKEYIVVILGSKNRFQDTKALIWALEKK